MQENWNCDEIEEDFLEDFPPYDIEELTKEDVLSDLVMDYLVSIRNPSERLRQMERVKEKAKEFKVVGSFNKIYKQKEDAVGIKNLEENDKLVFPGMESTIYQTSGRYILDETGKIWENVPKVGRILVCYHPILPVEEYKNVETRTEKIKLAFYKKNKWEYTIEEKSKIASSQAIVKLSDLGISVTSENAKALVRYLAEIENFNKDKIETKESASKLGWMGENFIPYTNQYEYDGDTSFKYIFEAIKEKGDYKKWKDKMKELRNKSKTYKLMMATSFASPLVEILKINPFILHIWGKSETGKTLGEMGCASIWGNPAKGKLLITLDSTKVAIERHNNFLQNFPLFIDELQITKGTDIDYESLIYLLTEGQGKSRGTKEGGLEATTQWNNIIFLSGEEPITKPTFKEGAKNRVIEVEENNTIIENGNEVANFIYNNYGFAGKDFIKIIRDNKDLIFELYNEFVEILRKYSIHSKQINALATILVADKITSEMIFQDKPFTVEEVKAYFTKDVDETDRYINLIIDIANSNINKFYAEGEEEPKGTVWGKIEKSNNEIEYYDFIPTELYNILRQENINWDGIKKKFVDKGYVVKSNDGRYQVNIRTPKGSQRMIKIKNIFNIDRKSVV